MHKKEDEEVAKEVTELKDLWENFVSEEIGTLDATVATFFAVDMLGQCTNVLYEAGHFKSMDEALSTIQSYVQQSVQEYRDAQIYPRQ